MGLNRRRFLQSAAVTSLFRSQLHAFALPDDSAGNAGHTLFVGTQTVATSKGVYAYGWDSERGALNLMGLAVATPMPTFLTLSRDKRFLFVANETDAFDGKQSGGVSSFRVVHGPKPKLALISSEPAGGQATCYVGLDQTGRVLLCANYGGGSASSFLVDSEGRIGPAVSHFQYTGHGPNSERQDAPHVHRAMASPGNRFALFADLGLDQIHIYHLDPVTGRLTPNDPPAWHAPAGSGPRSLRFHPNGRWAYCVVEMGSAVILLEWDETKGTLTTRQQVSLVPDGFKGRSQASEVVIDRSGRFLYAADRYYDGLYSFNIDGSSGDLHGMTRTECGGKTPRLIALDPSEHWLLSANQDSDNIAVFARDPQSGKLATQGKSVPQSKPQCLVFV